MIMNKQTNLFRDGISQRNRLLRTLEPDYVSVDERSEADLLTFIQKYAATLNYYDELNHPQGNWSPFFAGDIQNMVAYIKNPESFDDDESVRRKLSQPHLVLLFAFLQLLRYPQQQFNQLTQRHLEFYYKEVLKLTEKEEIPDKIHTIFELAADQTVYRLQPGTLLKAGQDSQGIDLNYAIDEEVVLNQAQIASIKTLSAVKTYTDLRSIHQQGNRDNNSFEQMLKWAVGDPNQGDSFPDLGTTPVDITVLNTLYQTISNQLVGQIADEQKNYILEQLFFATIDDFKYCLEINARQNSTGTSQSKPPLESEWEQVYSLIEKAYRKKINRKRRQVLNSAHRNAGFDSMMRLALGTPNPGDSLPEMPSGYDNLEQIRSNLDELNPDLFVVRYVKEQLYMSVEDFRKIMEIKGNATDIDDSAWQEVYRLLEKAQAKKQNFTYPAIGKQEIKRIEATPILESAAEAETELQRFSPFTTVTQPQTTSLGFAITSPLLILKEGTRKITLLFACKANTLNREELEKIIQDTNPFEIYLSTDQEWITPSSITLQISDLILEEPLKSYTTKQITLNTPTADGDNLTRITLSRATLPPENGGESVVVFDDGRTFKIIERISDREATVEAIGLMPNHTATRINLYSAAAVYLDSLHFQLTVDSTLPAILPPQPDASTVSLDTPYPVIKLVLKNRVKGDTAAEIVSDYELLKSIRLDKVNLQVEVGTIQDLQLRNDNSLLNPKSPFKPFGSNPKVGSGFYIANSEISSKKLDRLALNITWMGLPDDFASHYQAYTQVGLVNPAIANNSFKVSCKVFNNRNQYLIGSSQPIFSQNGSALSSTLQLDYPSLTIDAYTFNPSALETETDDPFEQTRYFKLELESPNFGHDLYPLVMTKVALSTDNAIKSLTVYQPYTPEIKTLSLDYTASVQIDLTVAQTASRVFQFNPFGYVELGAFKGENSPYPEDYLLPQYDEAGALFLGIRNLHPPQDLSLLFQLVPGSANVELTKPDIHWSYLSRDRWQDFQDIQILSDTTNGLVDSGIIRLSIPAAATAENHRFPKGLHWLRATVQNNAAAIPDTLDIKAQAVSATFVNQGNATEHLSQPLAADSIQGLVTRDAAVKAVKQPYTSFQGKMKENTPRFNIRVSERLRHKQRALTPWDYERLVLERFPEIYKVKCITSTIGSDNPSAANVTVVVVPDIANTAPFFPLEPKAPLYLLKEIEAYLKAHTSPFVNLVVKNPRYERIKYRVNIRLRPGYEQGYYLKQLNEDIKRFLSPWAYEGQVDITFGSSIHGSLVIHFIEKRPYVDYVANLSLLEQIDVEAEAQGDSPLEFRINESNLAQVQHPDSILVSATEHLINLITTEKYQDLDFEGIGYMIIGTDFVVS